MKPRKSADDGNDIRLLWQEIARSEVTKQRRRLALLTDEQRAVLQSALISVADHMFESVVHGADDRHVDRAKYFNIWRRRAVAV